eukprot:TRINITY_DN1352_c0_g1_i1.p1 TRINITY_DN1352_c0_g1~~TRINITY_DN1352_c0_g1_i1.p1  ORF type:complete len:463 (-),score=93.33 TRINITY_DN1352_c0_g1_i1:334-1722(-)
MSYLSKTDTDTMLAARTNSIGGRSSLLAAAAAAAAEAAEFEPHLPPSIVGTFSNHGVEHDFSYNQVVKINQDRGSVDYPSFGGDQAALFCVMDGHGRNGDKVSDYCILQLHEVLAENEAGLLKNPELALENAYMEVDRGLHKTLAIDSRHSGTSAVTVYLKDKKLWIANAGDSRAVLVSESPDGRLVASDLSHDQNPDTPGEKERLEAFGGVVDPPEEEGLSARVWTPDNNIGLSMARSLGDHILAKYGVIAEPEITTHDITSNDSVMILASDGIWEFISSQEAADIVNLNPDNATEACKNLIMVATRRWREEEGPYRDDITAIVIFLQPLWEHMASHGEEGHAQSECSDNRRRNTSELPQLGGSLDSIPVLNPCEDGDKAINFRRRRLSAHGEGGSDMKELAAKATADHQAHIPSLSPEGTSPQGPFSRRNRRPSLSQDMDPSGQEIVPRALGGSCGNIRL